MVFGQDDAAVPDAGSTALQQGRRIVDDARVRDDEWTFVALSATLYRPVPVRCGRQDTVLPRCVSMTLHVNAAGYVCCDACLFSNATMDSTTIHRFSPLPTPAPRSGSDIIRDVSIVVATLMGALMCYRMYLDRKVRPTVAAPVHA